MSKNFPIPSLSAGGATFLSGEKVCVLAIGTISSEAMLAVQKCISEGLKPELVLFHTLKPFPNNLLINLSKKFRKFVTVEEHSKHGGFGEHVCRVFSNNAESIQVYCIGTGDEFLHTVGSQNYGRTFFNIDHESIYKTIKNLYT